MKKFLNLGKLFSRSKKDNVGKSPWRIHQKNLKIHTSVIIDPLATVKIFNPSGSKISLEIGEDSHIFAQFNILRPQAKITVGKRCQLGNVNFVCALEIRIGDDCIMAWGINIMDNDSHSLYWEERKNDVKQSRKDYLDGNINKNKDWSHVACKPIHIGNKVWVGFNAIILKGVKIGDGAVVGAGSVITKDIPSCCVVAGNPAKVIKKLNKRR